MKRYIKLFYCGLTKVGKIFGTYLVKTKKLN